MRGGVGGSNECCRRMMSWFNELNNVLISSHRDELFTFDVVDDVVKNDIFVVVVVVVVDVVPQGTSYTKEDKSKVRKDLTSAFFFKGCMTSLYQNKTITKNDKSFLY